MIFFTMWSPKGKKGRGGGSQPLRVSKNIEKNLVSISSNFLQLLF